MILNKVILAGKSSVQLRVGFARSLSSSTRERKGFFQRNFDLESNTGSRETNRWTMFVPAFSTHLCLGAPYGWSAISAQLTREHGLVSSAASDWGLELASYPMSLMMAAGGISAALLGKLSLRLGVRKSLACGGLLYGVGFGVAAAGVSTHSLGLLYFGNLVTGLGAGLCYTPPIQACLDWFPDRKGLASGIVIAGYGSGALVFTPLIGLLTSKLSSLPTYLGNDVAVITEGGRQFAQVGGQLREVVFATSGELLKLPYDGLAEGFYLVGSGNTGVAASLLTMGALYAVTVVTSSLVIRRPPPGWLPAGYSPTVTEGGLGASVHVDNLFRTPQFWLLFSTSTLLTMGGMGIMSVAKPMIQSVFADSMPGLVTTSFASGYLMALASANWAGRLGWATLSDKIGRRNTFHLYTLGSVPIFGSIPFLITECVSHPSGPLANIYLAAFCVSTVAAISVLGGVFSVLPAYEADLYGPKGSHQTKKLNYWKFPFDALGGQNNVHFY